MVCPLVVAAGMKNAYPSAVDEGVWRECVGESCSWWVCQYDGCALNLLAFAAMEQLGYVPVKYEEGGQG